MKRKSYLFKLLKYRKNEFKGIRYILEGFGDLGLFNKWLFFTKFLSDEASKKKISIKYKKFKRFGKFSRQLNKKSSIKLSKKIMYGLVNYPDIRMEDTLIMDYLIKFKFFLMLKKKRIKKNKKMVISKVHKNKD